MENSAAQTNSGGLFLLINHDQLLVATDSLDEPFRFIGKYE
jgi:hypothetical protein